MKIKYLLIKHFFLIALGCCLFNMHSAFALTYYSKMDGSWDDSNSWVTDKCGGSVNAGSFPKAGDEVVICDGTQITVTTSAFCDKLTVGGGVSGILSYNTTAATFIFVQGNVEVKVGGRIEYTGNAGLQHIFDISGDFINSGTVVFRQDVDDYVKIFFLGNTNSKVSNSGGSWVLSTMSLNKGIKSSVVDIEDSGFSKALTDGSSIINYTSVSLTKGTLRHNNGGELSNIYNPGGTINDPLTIPAEVALEGFKGIMKIVVNNITYLQGDIRVAGGTVAISVGTLGSLTPYGLYYQGTTPRITLQNGGVLQIAGAFKDDPATPSSIVFYMVGTSKMDVGMFKSTVETFKITPNSRFHMSFGTITIHNASNYTDPSVITPTDIELMSDYTEVTGGELVFGGDFTVNPQQFRFTGCKQFPHIVVGSRIAGPPITLVPYTHICQSPRWKFDILSMRITNGSTLDMRDSRVTSNNIIMNITSATPNDSLGFYNEGVFNARSSLVIFSGQYQHIGGTKYPVFSSLMVGDDLIKKGDLWTGPILKDNILVIDTTFLFRNFDLRGKELKTGLSETQPGFMSVNQNCGVFHGTLTRYFKKNKSNLDFTDNLNDYTATDLPFYITDLQTITNSCGYKFHIDSDNASRIFRIAAPVNPQSSGYISVKYMGYHINDDGSKMLFARCNYIDRGDQVNLIAGFNWAVSAESSLGTGYYDVAGKHMSLTLDNPDINNLRLLQLTGDLLGGVGFVGTNRGTAPLVGSSYYYDIFGKPCFFYRAKPGFASLIYITRTSLNYVELNNKFYVGTLVEANPSTYSTQVSSLTFRYFDNADPYPFPTIAARLDSDVRVAPTELLESQESVFPNPAQRIAEVSIAIPTEMKTDNVLIQFINVYGEKMIENNFTVDFSRKVVINLSKYNLKEGVYMILVSDGTSSWRQRLVITK